MRRNFLVIEPICHSDEHLMFNSKLLSMIDNIEANYFWCGDHHYGKELFKDQTGTTFSTISYNFAYTPKEAMRRYIHIFKVIRKAKNIDTILFLSIDNTLFPFLGLFLFRTLRRKKVVCIIHNNLSALKKSKSKSTVFRFLERIVRIQFVVLTEAMRKVADQLLIRPTILIHHPFYDKLKKEKSRSNIFLILGRQAVTFYENGFYEKFKSECINYYKNHNNLPKLILGVPNEIKWIDGIEAVPEVEFISGFIPRLKYISYFNEASFFVFPDVDDDEVRASGTLVDCLSSGLIFVGPRTGHFSEFEGCGILYDRGKFSDAIGKALLLTNLEIKQMQLKISEKIDCYERRNKQVLASLFN